MSFERALWITRREDVREVRNYLVAHEHGLQRLNTTSRAAIKDLVDEGILREITGRSWGQLFLADEILVAAQGTTDTEPGVA
jgi:hypothetical protein